MRRKRRLWKCCRSLRLACEITVLKMPLKLKRKLWIIIPADLCQKTKVKRMKPNGGTRDYHISDEQLRQWSDELKQKGPTTLRKHLSFLIETLPHVMLVSKRNFTSWREFENILKELSEQGGDNQVCNLAKKALKEVEPITFEVIVRKLKY